MKSRKKRQSHCRRPSAFTLVVLLTMAVAIVIANRIEEVNFQSQPLVSESYGWPIQWYRYIFYLGPVYCGLGWHYDPARLVANLLLWLAMFAAVAVPCEWVRPIRWWRRDDPMLSPSARAQTKKLYPEKALRDLEW